MIVKAYRAGLPPERHHVEAMLRRHEPIPAEAQDFLANEFVRLNPKKRGGQPKSEFAKKIGSIKKALALVHEIEQLTLSSGGKLNKAYALYAKNHFPMQPESVEREYRQALKLKRVYDATKANGWRQLEELDDTRREKLLQLVVQFISKRTDK
jgi:hypothetical protein